MPIPGQTFTINDPGLGLTTPATNTPLYLGVSSSGDENVLKTANNIPDVVADLGQGPLSEAICHALAVAGGPIRYMKLTSSVAGANGSVTQSGAGPLITLANAPNDDYDAVVTVVAGGALGVGTFKYTLDGGKTESETRTIPSGGTFTIPDTGVEITFPAGTYVAGETYSWTSTAPHYNATNINTAVTQLLLETLGWDFIVFTGDAADAATAATNFSAIDGHMTSFENGFRFLRAWMGAGKDTAANVLTSFASVTSTRVGAVFSTARHASAKPIEGRAVPSLPAVNVVGARATQALISTDLKRVPSGPLSTVTEIGHDEYLDNQGLDDAKITTLRTWPGRAGFFVTQGRLKAPGGSDFQFWQLGRVFDVGLDAVHRIQQTFIGRGVRTVNSPVGAIDERDAARLETSVERELRIQLTEPQNAEGFTGHVTDLAYTIDRTNNLLSSQTLQSSLAIKPLGYISFIVTQAGFVLTLGEEPAEEPGEEG